MNFFTFFTSTSEVGIEREVIKEVEREGEKNGHTNDDVLPDS